MATSKINKTIEPFNVLLGGIKSTNANSSSDTVLTLNEPLNKFSLISLCTSYYTNGAPYYAGETVSSEQIRMFTSEWIYVNSSDATKKFLVKYVDNTHLTVRFEGTASDTFCLSVRGIL